MSEASSSTQLTEQPQSSTDRCEINGVSHKWNAAANSWLPDVSIDEDFVAQYQANYGVHYDYDKMEAPKPSAPVVESKPKLTKEEKRVMKRERAEAEAQRANDWIDVDQSKQHTSLRLRSAADNNRGAIYRTFHFL